MATNWREYQEEAAEFFRSLGMIASTDVTLEGVRTNHDVDALVQIELAGFTVRWIIECKHWKDPVNKLHVLALREIVSDLGADRGIILCEIGFQSGAFEAAQFTNVQVSSLAELGKTSKEAIASFKIRELFNRATTARDRYWEIPKSTRIKKGLRGEPGVSSSNYTGIFVAEESEKILGLDFRGTFPIILDELGCLKLGCSYPQILADSNEVLSLLEPLIADLERRLDDAEG